jgi:hypothetical protein
MNKHKTEKRNKHGGRKKQNRKTKTEERTRSCSKKIQKKPNKRRNTGKKTMDRNFEKLTTTEERRRQLVETGSLRSVAPETRK